MTKTKEMMLLVVTFCMLMTVQVYAQDGQRPQRDPKRMTERLAKELNFTDAQNQQLTELNKKNDGDNYNRKGYLDGFKNILTDEQHKQLQDMRHKRMDGKGRRGTN